jgi:GNAT superfamily N-acetyltransferase
MRLRMANPSDGEAIAATVSEAFAPFEALYTPAAFLATTPTPEQLRARWAEGPTWVAERDGTVVGTVAAVPEPTQLYIRSMAVRPVVQGQGIGVQLLQAMEIVALAQRYSRLGLSTTPFLHAALRLYERSGFQRTREADLFGTPLIVLTKELRVP